MKIQLSMQWRAVDMASNRLVYLYQNEKETGTNNKLFKTYDWEDDNTSYHSKTFSAVTVSLSDIQDSKFVIRYRASGTWDDDWKNKNVTAVLTFSK